MSSAPSEWRLVNLRRRCRDDIGSPSRRGVCSRFVFFFLSLPTSARLFLCTPSTREDNPEVETGALTPGSPSSLPLDLSFSRHSPNHAGLALMEPSPWASCCAFHKTCQPWSQELPSPQASSALCRGACFIFGLGYSGQRLLCIFSSSSPYASLLADISFPWLTLRPLGLPFS